MHVTTLYVDQKGGQENDHVVRGTSMQHPWHLAQTCTPDVQFRRSNIVKRSIFNAQRAVMGKNVTFVYGTADVESKLYRQAVLSLAANQQRA